MSLNVSIPDLCIQAFLLRMRRGDITEADWRYGYEKLQEDSAKRELLESAREELCDARRSEVRSILEQLQLLPESLISTLYGIDVTGNPLFFETHGRFITKERYIATTLRDYYLKIFDLFLDGEGSSFYPGLPVSTWMEPVPNFERRWETI